MCGVGQYWSPLGHVEFFACSLRTWSDRLNLARLVSSAVSRFQMVWVPSASDLCFLGAGFSSGITGSGLSASRVRFGDLTGDIAGGVLSAISAKMATISWSEIAVAMVEF